MHSIIFPKGSYSTQRITLDYFAFTLLRSLIFPGRKHYRMKVLFPENTEKCRVSRAKLVKVAKFFAFYFRSISFPGNNCGIARIQHVLPFLLFFTRRVDPCLESCEPEQRAGARGKNPWKESARIAPKDKRGRGFV